MMLDAEGVLMGTRFYATQEANGHPEAKRRIVAAEGGQTVRSIVFDLSRRNRWPAPYTDTGGEFRRPAGSSHHLQSGKLRDAGVC
jgi:NAD(P)H-dependent flavin oxidoreductase YrpB (nitropropane dioxygenase family)